ncbi:hypothetical protein SCHPADRAFT_928980 [Schizopora paradoxa]|uniref:WD40 repeat-like protein n=1 Tax=Schizopora paradoxa TaxID=27342 RepID=A0A0H2RTR0_9AGAM|nr:hypothetical protein SCHPADRAFT_928980 [Schizopora paradoxa]
MKHTARAPNDNKRRREESEERDEKINLKLPKTELKEEGQESDNDVEEVLDGSHSNAGPSRPKRQTKGVFQMKPCPNDCLLSSPNWFKNRETLTMRVAKDLRGEGKVVVNAIFFKDGVAFDWMLDLSVKQSPKGSKEDPFKIESESSDSEVSNSDDESSSSSDSSSSASSLSSRRSNTGHDRMKRSFAFRGKTAPMQSPEVHTENVVLPKVNFGRPRRLLLRSDPFPLVSVSMSKDIQSIDKGSKKRIHDFSIPSESERGDNVQDASAFSELAVIGCKGDADQLQLLRQTKPHRKPNLISFERRPHKGGVNCLSNIGGGPSSYTVFSGGFDKTIVMWSIKRERQSFKNEITTLSVVHKACISALASDGDRLYSASGTTLFMTDIRSQAEANSSRFSTKVQQIHMHPTDKSMVVLEVADLHEQVRIYDVRIGLRGRPQMAFGHSDESKGKLLTSGSRRGATSESYFVRGYHDGLICLWDYRQANPNTIRVSQAEEPVFHTIFGASANEVWSFSGNTVGYHNVTF